MARAAAAQYVGVAPIEHIYPSVRTNKQLDRVPAIAEPTLDALTRMSGVINNRTDQINQLIKDTKTVTDQVAGSQHELSIIVGQGAQLAGKITAREALVTRLLDGLADLTAQAELLADAEAALRELLLPAH